MMNRKQKYDDYNELVCMRFLRFWLKIRTRHMPKFPQARWERLFCKAYQDCFKFLKSKGMLSSEPDGYFERIKDGYYRK